MKLGNLNPPKGATHSKKRLGFGESSGHGKTSGRGTKGQKSRSGFTHRPAFEGGQMPLVRRIPKRGFHAHQAEPAQVVNVESLNRFPAGSVVDPQLMAQSGLIAASRFSVKILGNGDLTKKLTVKAHSFSKSASEKISKAGGTVEQIA